MAHCVRLLRTLCPKSFLLNRSTCLTVPAAFSEHRTALENHRSRFSTSAPKAKKETISLTFVKACGEVLKAKATVGDTLLDTLVDNDLDFPGYGACEGTLACSTCHLIFKEENYNQLPEPTDEENDMLDLAFELQDTSRLGCQVTVTKEMDGWEVKVPSGVSDAREV